MLGPYCMLTQTPALEHLRHVAKGAVVYLEAAVLLLELLADRNGVRIQVEGVQATLGGQPRENSARMPAAPKGAVHIDTVRLRQDHDPQRFLAHGGRVRAGGLQAAISLQQI